MSKKMVVKVNGNPYNVELGDVSENPVSVKVNGTKYEVDFSSEAPVAAVEAPKKVATPIVAVPAATPVSSAGTLTAPMPGTILDISVKIGDKLTAGQPVCALEAMKMKNIIRSPRPGTVASIEVSVGQKVAFGTVIIRYA